MMRSLWTAASGMIAQQTNIDNISNNLANVNTTGFKKERVEFKALLYQTMQRADRDPANQAGRPVNLQLGLGVRPIATSRLFDTSNFEATYNPLDVAIQGPGMFVVDRLGQEVYTKDGTFKLSITEDGRMITTSDGYPILSVDGEPIYIPDEVEVGSLSIGQDGTLSYSTGQGFEAIEGQIALVQFTNFQGLEAIGSNFFQTTIASGDPMYEVDGNLSRLSTLHGGYIEMSNVQVAEEMVHMIVAQRAYEINAKAITTTDEMLQTANQLKR